MHQTDLDALILSDRVKEADGTDAAASAAASVGAND